MSLRRSLTAVFCALLCAASAFATDFVVTKTNDTNDGVCDADCSLREAIAAANASPGADRVILGSGLSYTFSIASALTISDSLTIEGNASTVDAMGLSRVFDVGNVSVTINNLTIRGGASTGFLSPGGGLRIQNGTAILNNCTVTANSSADDGGGIAVIGSYDTTNGASLAHLTVNNSTVSNNTAAQGGGILCALCALSGSGSTIISNSASSGDGGGIDMVGDSSTLMLIGCALVSNTASMGRGGGLSVPFGSSNPNVTVSRIAGNSALLGNAFFGSAGSLFAINNWWASNSGPSIPGDLGGVATVTPYLVLNATAAPTIIPLGSMLTLSADLRFNSSNADTSSAGTVPNGTSITFTGTGGTLNPASSLTTAGVASSTYTATGPKGPATLTVALDGQFVSTTVHIGYQSFTDDPLISGVTIIRAVHISEMRTRTNAVRLAHGLGAYMWSTSATTGSLILAQDILDLRTALAAAYSSASQTPPTYTDPITQGSIVKAIDVSQLRLAIIALE